MMFKEGLFDLAFWGYFIEERVASPYGPRFRFGFRTPTALLSTVRFSLREAFVGAALPATFGHPFLAFL